MRTKKSVLEVEIRNFKSIERAKLRLPKVTILVGPPASGKSNLLEALATFGYVIKAWLEVKAGNYPSIGHIPYYNDIVRAVFCEDVLNRLRGPGREAVIKVRPLELHIGCGEARDEVIVSLKREVKGKQPHERQGTLIEGRIKLRQREEMTEQLSLIPSVKDMSSFLLWLAQSAKMLATTAEKAKINEVSEPGEVSIPPTVSVPRLYGFDRMKVIIRIMSQSVDRPYPIWYLSELGDNLGSILYTNDKVLDRVNAVLSEISSMKVSPLSTRALAYYDGKREVGPASVSDTVLRLLYGLTAIATAGKERSVKVSQSTETLLTPIVMLEEPEAHMYPLVFTGFRRELKAAIRESGEGTRFVITTHSGALAELIYEDLGEENVAIYFTMRRKSGPTELYEVDVEALIDLYGGGADIDDIITQPRPVIEEIIEKGILKPAT